MWLFPPIFWRRARARDQFRQKVENQKKAFIELAQKLPTGFRFPLKRSAATHEEPPEDVRIEDEKILDNWLQSANLQIVRVYEENDPVLQSPKLVDSVIKDFQDLDDIYRFLWTTYEEIPTTSVSPKVESELEIRLKDVLEYKNQVILWGPPGTSKTHAAIKVTEALVGNNPEQYDIVQFHPSYSYEDFVEGIVVDVAKGQPVYNVKARARLIMGCLSYFLMSSEDSVGREKRASYIRKSWEASRWDPSRYGGTIEAIRDFTASGSTNILLREALSEAGYPPEDLELLKIASKDATDIIVALPKDARAIIKEKEETRKAYNEMLRYKDRTQKIIGKVYSINDVFKEKFNARFFNTNEMIYPHIIESSFDDTDFNFKILALAQIFDVPLDPLRELIKDERTRKLKEFRTLTSINLIKLWLQENSVKYEFRMIDIWRNIRNLRNRFPVHNSNEEAIKALRFFGEKPISVNYKRLWTVILDEFVKSLDYFIKLLEEFHSK